MTLIELLVFLYFAFIAYGISVGLTSVTGIPWGWWFVPVLCAELFGMYKLASWGERKPKKPTSSTQE